MTSLKTKAKTGPEIKEWSVHQGKMFLHYYMGLWYECLMYYLYWKNNSTKFGVWLLSWYFLSLYISLSSSPVDVSCVWLNYIYSCVFFFIFVYNLACVRCLMKGFGLCFRIIPENPNQVCGFLRSCKVLVWCQREIHEWNNVKQGEGAKSIMFLTFLFSNDWCIQRKNNKLKACSRCCQEMDY